MTPRQILITATLILGGIVAGVGLHVTGVQEQQIRDQMTAAGYTVILGDPSIGEPDTFKAKD